LLDSAVWRRFDKIIEFPEPSDQIRRRIFELSLSKVPGKFNIEELVKLTEGFTGAEIKLVVREAVLNSLIGGEEKIRHEMLVDAVNNVKKRLNLKMSY
jgi:SpoVK/Ycf46/Vps4 family AAA+-type ATPase